MRGIQRVRSDASAKIDICGYGHGDLPCGFLGIAVTVDRYDEISALMGADGGDIIRGMCMWVVVQGRWKEMTNEKRMSARVTLMREMGW